MTIDFAIITTPRPKPTIEKSVQSLRNTGHMGLIQVFTEPQGRFDIPGCSIHYNTTHLGCFKNYHQALEHLCHNSNATYICVLSDDFVYTKHLFKKLGMVIYDDNFGYAALFTPEGMTLDPCRIRLPNWTKINMGWKASWGGLYVFKRTIAKEIIKHEFYVDHLINYQANQQIDHCIPEVCYQMDLDQWFHNPSLADHIGNTSTIGHVHNKWSKGLHFRL